MFKLPALPSLLDALPKEEYVPPNHFACVVPALPSWLPSPSVDELYRTKTYRNLPPETNIEGLVKYLHQNRVMWEVHVNLPQHSENRGKTTPSKAKEPTPSKNTPEPVQIPSTALYRPRRKRKLKKVSKVVSVCPWCSSNDTPEWRLGPNGVKLCNACGLYYRKKLKENDKSLKRTVNVDILTELEKKKKELRSGSE